MIGLNSQRKAAPKFTGAAGGFKMLQREIILTPGSISRASILSLGILVVRCIGGGRSGGIMYNTAGTGDGASGAPEAVGNFFVDKDSTLTGLVGRGGAASSDTATTGYTAGGYTVVNVTSSFGSGQVFADTSAPMNGNTNGATYPGLGASQCCVAGIRCNGGNLGEAGGGNYDPSGGRAGYGGRGAGPFGGAGGRPNASLVGLAGQAPGGGGSAYKQYQNGPGYAGAGGDGGIILEWWG